MGRPSRRGALLDAGVDVLHRRGYAAASVESITEAVGVPKGAFFKHFGSKEAFASEALRRYFERWQQQIAPVFNDPKVRAVQKMRAMLAAATSGAEKSSYSFGCLIGNLSAELSGEHDSVRQTLVEIFRDWAASFEGVIKAGQQAGELRLALSPARAARLIVNGLQGAQLRCKVDRTSVALLDLEETIFSVLLQPGDMAAQAEQSYKKSPGLRRRER